MKSKNLHVGTRETSQLGGWIRSWGPALAWAATIFVLSSISQQSFPKPPLVQADKLVHFALYGTLAALCARGLRRGGRRDLAIWIGAVVLATIYGMSDEFHQRFVPGRNADWADVAADAIGAVLGAGATVAFFRRQRRRAAH